MNLVQMQIMLAAFFTAWGLWMILQPAVLPWLP